MEQLELTLEDVADIFDGYRLAEAWDEMFAAPGKPRASYDVLVSVLQPMDPAELRYRADQLARVFTDRGVTYDYAGEERPFPLDLIPRVIDAVEWDLVSRGVRQRVKALEAFLEDPDPLADSLGDQVPLVGVDDPRDEVGGHRPFLARVVVGDAPVGEHSGQLIGAVPQLTRVHRLEHRDQRVVGGARLARGREHLVPGLREPVTIENVRHNPQSRESLFHAYFRR